MRSALVLIALVSVLVGCGGNRSNERSGATIASTLWPFAGYFEGRLRQLQIPPNGHAWEQMWPDPGSGKVALLIDFRIAHRQGTAKAATAQATVTRVEILNRKWFTKARPAPYVGERGTIRVRNAGDLQGVVIYEGLTGVYYCAGGLQSLPPGPCRTPWRQGHVRKSD
jgi:hypothetical protein